MLINNERELKGKRRFFPLLFFVHLELILLSSGQLHSGEVSPE
jgi:hypothetical protein